VPSPEHVRELAALDERLARVAARMAAEDAQLARPREAWVLGVQARLAAAAANPVVCGPWAAAPPYRAGSAEQALATAQPPEAGDPAVDWQPRPDWRDGEVHALPDRNAAHHLRRTLTVAQPREAVLALDCADAVAAWVNGAEVARRVVPRSADRPLDLGAVELRLELRAGANELLLKLANGRAATGFRFVLRDGSEPQAVLDAARAPRAGRTPAQELELARHYRELAPELESLRAERRRIDGARARVPVATSLVMQERAASRPTHLLERGAFDRPREPVHPATPAALHPWPDGAPRNRLGLAQWLCDPRNPLTARVLANRVWAQYFGRGLVATLDDFGVQGDRPSHPELLDWLALELVRNGWRQKALHRAIVLSATFRQASATPAETRARDPDNVWLARYPRLRLAAEEVRDVALAAAGILDDRVGGPSVMPPQPPGVWEQSFSTHDLPERWLDAPGRDRWRRGIYTFLRRTAPYPSHVLLDGGERDVCRVARARTATAVQALVTWNDPAFVEAAAHLARASREADAARGLRALLRRCVARAPRDGEVARLQQLLATARAGYARQPDAARALLEHARVAPDGDPAELAAWTVVANAVLNLDETLTNH
jgi:hypothetical protein